MILFDGKVQVISLESVCSFVKSDEMIIENRLTLNQLPQNNVKFDIRNEKVMK